MEAPSVRLRRLHRECGHSALRGALVIHALRHVAFDWDGLKSQKTHGYKQSFKVRMGGSENKPSLSSTTALHGH
ncbi:hypothetical protein DKX38_013403 [Salix brachista]|uniref:Uncharacterized protein n=1 Tax=Salix brachista TaxID=2182728 RepID=A0A5N5LSP3_9ROSI|nr:hypothetical protein DKX38_013403 [Salix brachista]